MYIKKLIDPINNIERFDSTLDTYDIHGITSKSPLRGNMTGIKALIKSIHILPVIMVLVLQVPAFGDDTVKPIVASSHIKYQVIQKNLTIFTAVTPYDSDLKVREAFLNWFKRGFETVLKGHSPLMIEWLDSPEGKAGQIGYDLGMDEAGRHLNKEPESSLQSVPIPVTN